MPGPCVGCLLYLFILANNSQPIALYRAFLNKRVLPIDKQPGVSRVHCREIFGRFLGKCVVKVAGFQAREEYGNLNTCARLEAGIEDTIHTVRNLLNTLTLEWTDIIPGATNNDGDHDDGYPSTKTPDW